MHTATHPPRAHKGHPTTKASLRHIMLTHKPTLHSSSIGTLHLHLRRLDLRRTLPRRECLPKPQLLPLLSQQKPELVISPICHGPQRVGARAATLFPASVMHQVQQRVRRPRTHRPHVAPLRLRLPPSTMMTIIPFARPRTFAPTMTILFAHQRTCVPRMKATLPNPT